MINDRFILTAAHCLGDKNTGKPKPISDFEVTLHAYTREEIRNQLKVKISNVIMNEGYRKFDKRDFDDIGLIELAEPLTSNHRLMPVSLSKYNDYDNLIFTGWGMTHNPEKKRAENSETLREVELKELPAQQCVSSKWYD